MSDDPHDCEKVDTTHAYINQVTQNYFVNIHLLWFLTPLLSSPKVLLHPTKPFIFTTDLTLDKVYTYSRELGTGKLIFFLNLDSFLSLSLFLSSLSLLSLSLVTQFLFFSLKILSYSLSSLSMIFLFFF